MNKARLVGVLALLLAGCASDGGTEVADGQGSESNAPQAQRGRDVLPLKVADGQGSESNAPDMTERTVESAEAQGAGSDGASSDPATEGAASGDSGGEEAAVDDPAVDDPVEADPSVDDPVVDDPVVDDPVVDDPVVDDPVVDDPVVDEGPMCDDPLAEGVTLGEGACTNDADVCIVGVEPWGDTYAQIIDDNSGAFGPNAGDVSTALDAEGISPSCRDCWIAQLECATDQIIMNLADCVPACTSDPAGDICLACQAPCMEAFKDCSGIELPM